MPMNNIYRALHELTPEELANVKCYLCMDTGQCYNCLGAGCTPVWDPERHKPRPGGGMRICWRCEGRKVCPECQPETPKAA